MSDDLNSSSSNKEVSPRPLTGYHVFFILMTFFMVFASVDAFIVTMAIKTMPGTNVKSSYEASQHFNNTLVEISEQKSRGWHVTIEANDMKAGYPLTVEIKDKSGNNLSGLKTIARIERPINDKMDQTISLTDNGNGKYVTNYPKLEPGQWRLSLEIYDGDKIMFTSNRRFEII